MEAEHFQMSGVPCGCQRGAAHRRWGSNGVSRVCPAKELRPRAKGNEEPLKFCWVFIPKGPLQ